MNWDKSRRGAFYRIDSRTGFKEWSTDTHQEWTGLWVADPDPKHPQESVRGRIDNQKVPFARPVPDPIYLTANQVTAASL